MQNHFKRKLIILAAVINAVIVLTTCDSVVIWPAVAITADATDISQTYATLNGQVLVDQFTKVGFESGTTTDYGYSIYNLNGSPGEGTYSYVSYRLNSLSPNTTYHYRIKIESSAGIIYGSDATFTTTDNKVVFNPDVNYGSVSDIDGNTYKTIKIGAQTWMAENLKATRLNDGTPIGLVTDDRQWWDSQSPSYCWVNNEEAKFRDTYGAIYNWRAVNSNKLCPSGWHVPANPEWTMMENSLGGQINIGYKIKEAGGTHWLNSNTSITNETGFTALPAGYRSFNGSFLPGSLYGYWRGAEAYWWSSSVAYTGGAYYQAFFYNTHTLLQASWRIEMGLSVRCIKDGQPAPLPGD